MFIPSLLPGQLVTENDVEFPVVGEIISVSPIVGGWEILVAFVEGVATYQFDVIGTPIAGPELRGCYLYKVDLTRF